MASTKVITLKARPSQVSHLCFPVNGVVERLRLVEIVGPGPQQFRPIQLGDQVTPFDFISFYSGLSTPSPDPSMLLYNSRGIMVDPQVQASWLVSLRGEPMAAALDKSINTRQNAYWAKYANKDPIISMMTELYAPMTTSPDVADTKPNLLNLLLILARRKEGQLVGVYSNNPLPPVMPALPDVVWGTSVLTTTGDFPDTTQTITTADSGYQTPIVDAQARSARAQISLLDEIFANFMAGQNLPHLSQVFANELQNIDLDLKQLQIAYLNTILMSPMSGVITGIYKNPGDWVQAGEPVIRVENNHFIILVGTLRHPGIISVGKTLTVTTKLYDSPGPPESGDAVIIAVRGHPNEDDLWEVHAIYDNTATHGTLGALPTNYRFDYDNTQVTIT